MTSVLTLKLTGPGIRSPHSEGFGLVRRGVARPACADAANDRRGSPDLHGDPGDDDLRTAITPAQRDALHALIHAYSPAPGAHWARRDRAIDFLWAGMLASLMTLAAASIDSGWNFVAAAGQSSPGTSRTM
ncbi:MAG: hypothetical protein JSS46_10405 [Proteobacteria bacterium]|jgi:hypothetical protein|nr:hypothetical protein [Pseudomonadota bacterium]